MINAGDDMDTGNIIDKAVSLPIEDRIMLVDILLHSLNPPESHIDGKWAVLAQKRLDDLRSGRVSGVDGEKVFTSIIEKYRK